MGAQPESVGDLRWSSLLSVFGALRRQAVQAETWAPTFLPVRSFQLRSGEGLAFGVRRGQFLMGDSRIRMSLLDVIGLVVVAVLVAFLCRRHEARFCRHSTENSDTGKFFDATSACDCVRRVRGNYLAVVCARSRDHGRRIRLHAQVRRTLRGRSYFSRCSANSPPPGVKEAEQSLG